MKKLKLILALGLMMLSLGAQTAKADELSDAMEKLQFYGFFAQTAMTMEPETKTVLEPLMAEAEALFEKEDATLDEVNAVITDIETALTPYAPDVMDDYIFSVRVQIKGMAQEDDNEECQQIIADADAQLKNIKWDSEKSFYENLQNLATAMFLIGETQAALEAARPVLYAVFDGAQTLTYYYNNQYDESNPNHKLYDSWDYGKWLYRIADDITKAVIDKSMKEVKLTTTGLMFHSTDGEGLLYAFINLHSITGLENLNTENVKYMNKMFYRCESLQSLDLSHFDTRNVEDMSSMFEGCNSLETLDLTGFNIDKVGTMDLMFAGCEHLRTIYCEGDWSQSSTLTSYSDIFYHCYNLGGERGTTFDKEQYEYYDEEEEKWYEKYDITYARVDGGEEAPGFFTKKFIPDPEVPEEIAAAKQELEQWMFAISMVYQVYDMTGDADGYAEMEALLVDANVIDLKKDATLAEINAQIATLKEAANAHKAEVILYYQILGAEELNALLEEGDSEECKQIIADAIDALNAALVWNDEIAYIENIDALAEAFGAIYDQAVLDLAAQRAKETATGVEEITNDKPQMTNKFFRNGKLYILRDGKTYNILGTEVR